MRAASLPDLLSFSRSGCSQLSCTPPRLEQSRGLCHERLVVFDLM